jgi:secreted trypsin-like serine protease
MPVFDGDKCQSVWGHTRAGQLNQTIQLCVGGQEGKDSCNGDSGSSLMTKRFNATAWPSYWKLIGLVSFGAPTCGLERVPGVYTKVRPYIDWILENVRN